jgi:hypothetical protein
MMQVEPVPAIWFHERRAGIRRPARSHDGARFGRRRRVRGSGARARGARWYQGCYPDAGASAHGWSPPMVTKRSVSLDEDVARAVETAATEDGVSFSAWLSGAAERQLRVRQGLRGVAAWESEAGELSAEEIAAGEALLGRLLSGVSGMASRVRRRQ